jgi:excisionase family DNA binding protein
MMSGMDKLVLTVQEAAEALGVSDDLVYELTARGELPCLHLGRRRVIPRRAVELLIEECVGTFDPGAVLPRLRNLRGGR